MSKQDETMALNQEGGEEAIQDTTPVDETKATGEVEEVKTDSTEEVEMTETETEKTPGKGANERIRELNSKAKAAEERVRSLEARIAELTASSQERPQEPQYIPQEPIVEEGEEITVAELDRRIRERESRILQQAEIRAELRARQAEAINRINAESSEVIKEFPELDPDSDSYNKELSDTITEATEAYIRQNPYSASVKQFVGRLMRATKGAVSKEVGEQREAIARQVQQAATRPTTIRQTEKPLHEKTIAELEAELEFVQA